MSAKTHSKRVLAKMDAQSPGAKPCAAKPMASWRTASPVSFHVQPRQMPNFFSRIIKRWPR
jgi:hypothetical protein